MRLPQVRRWREATVGVMCGLLVGCGSPPPRPAAPTETATSTSPTKPQKSVAGEWEDGELLGEPLVVEADLPFAEILYAARGRDATFVATGAREGDLILRTIVVTMFASMRRERSRSA